MIIRYLLVLLFSQALSLSLYAQSNPAVSSALNNADEDINRSDYNAALSKIDSVLRISPDNIEALKKRIDVYLLQEDFKGAGDYIDAAIKAHPDVMDFYFYRGVMNMHKGKYEKAIDDFDKVLSSDKFADMYKVYLNRGVARENLLRYELAMEDFNRAIELNSTDGNVYHSRAMLNYEQKDYEEAVKDFQKSLELSGDNPITLYNLGMTYYRLNDLSNACLYFHRACSMKNKNACRMVMMNCTTNLNLPK